MKRNIALPNLEQKVLNLHRNILKATKRHEYIYITIASLIFWVLFLGVSKTLTSGYHLTDDHELVRIAYDLKTNSLLETLINWMSNDLEIRFRPFYFFHRVLTVWVFGTNFTAISIYTGVLAALTSAALYKVLREIKAHPIAAITFPIITLIGPQTPIWWRLGPNETIGTFVLAHALYLLVLSVKHPARTYYRWLYLTAIIVATLCKESFILIVPAVMLFEIYLKQILQRLTIKEAVKTNFASNIAILTFLVVEILFIKAFVGSEEIGYAGVEGFAFANYLQTIGKALSANYLWAFILAAASILVFYKAANTQEAIKNGVYYIKKYWLVLLLVTFTVLTQAFLYTKSGISERYLLPTLISTVLLASLLYSEILRKSLIEYWLKVLLTAVIFTFLAFNIRAQYEAGQMFANDGFNTNTALKTIADSTNRDDLILVVADPVLNHEWGFSIASYVSKEIGRENVYSYEIHSQDSSSPYIAQLTQQYGEYFKDRSYDDIKNRSSEIKTLIVFSNTEAQFIEENKDWFNPDQFRRHDLWFIYIYDR